MKNFKGHLLTLVLVFSFFISLSHCAPAPKKVAAITEEEAEVEDYHDEETQEDYTIETTKEKIKPSNAKIDAEADEDEDEDEVKEEDSEDVSPDEFEPLTGLDDEYETEESETDEEVEDQLSLLKILLEQQKD